MRVQRARKIAAGCKDVHALIPSEYKTLLNQFSTTTKLTISELLCYFLGCARDGKIAEVDKPIDLNL